MPRPVEGFLTKDGTYFESENEANLHEAVYDLTKAYDNWLKSLGVTSTTFTLSFDIFLTWLLTNGETIQKYLKAHNQMPTDREPSPPPQE